MTGKEYIKNLQSKYPDEWSRFVSGENAGFAFYLNNVQVVIFRNAADVYQMQCSQPDEEYKIREILRKINAALADTRIQINDVDLANLTYGCSIQKPVRVI